LKKALFVSDIHGDQSKYLKITEIIEKELPGIVFIGGDILPSGIAKFTSLDISHKDFINGFLLPSFMRLKEKLLTNFPKIYMIMGNDDARIEEAALIDASTKRVWDYIHFHRRQYEEYKIFGYNFVPPTPFQLKDWEKYDVSRYIDPGCVSPETGLRTVPVRPLAVRTETIQQDLIDLTKNEELEKSIFLFHAPPYNSKLDRAALDGKMIDYVPLDVHCGSIAIQRFIEEKQPYITLHGHIHESTSMTGEYYEKIGNTHCFNAAHSGEELSIITFDLDNPSEHNRRLY
jgi:Icc-related predicted phosphoesterase